MPLSEQVLSKIEELHSTTILRGDQWLSNDDETSISLKSQFALEKGLAGVMVWSIDIDDFSGSSQGPHFPILRAINMAHADLL